MPWELCDDLASFARDASPFLQTDPVAHTVILGVLEQRAADQGDGSEHPLFAVLRTGGVVRGAAWRTPPYPLGVTLVAPDDARDLARLLAQRRPDVARVPAMVGPADAAHPLADELTVQLGRTWGPYFTETLYRLDGADALITDARPAPPGRCRPAHEADVPLLAQWFLAFADEAGTAAPPDPTARIRSGGIFCWVGDGVQAMCGGRPTGGGVARVGPVYTPPGRRGTGVATALVAEVCRRLFDDGIDAVTLYADDRNPTSTGIYRRMGFRPAASWVELRLV